MSPTLFCSLHFHAINLHPTGDIFLKFILTACNVFLYPAINKVTQQ